MTGRSGALLAASPAAIGGGLLVAAILAVVTTALSLRLLGVGRGWGKALLAGVSGWAVGGLLALGLGGWDWDTDGLLLQTLAVAVPTTMAIAVGVDLLARPGTLATADRAGLVVAPRPLRAVRRRIDVFRRYRELVGLLRAAGFGPFLGAVGRAERAGEPLGVRLRHVLEEAGGVYVKLGQIAASRVDLLPPDVCEQLALLQSRAPLEPAEAVRAVLEAELGPVDEVFATFEWAPLAAASIAQTHTAVLPSGEAVVVKVQRPGIDEVLERDLAALALVARLAQRRTAIGRDLRSAEVLGHFADNLRAEVDFRREGRAMTDMAHLVAEDPAAGRGDGAPVRIPRVHAELCTRRVLVQERLDGFSADDAARLAGPSIDRRALATGLMHTVLRQVLEYGFFHADPHPGNVFVLGDGSLGLVDFGAVGRLDPLERAAAIDMVAGLVRGDVALLRDGIEQVADVSAAPEGDRLDRTIARLMAEEMRPGGGVEPTALQNLVPALAHLGIDLPAGLVLLARALVTLDGTVRILSPGLSVASAAMEVAGPASGAGAIDAGALARDELAAAALRLRHLPDKVDRLATLATRGDLSLRTVVGEDGARVLRTLVNRAVLAAVGSFLLLSGSVLLVAPGGPTTLGDSSLINVFGYGGLLAGTVLVLRVVAAIARDGTT